MPPAAAMGRGRRQVGRNRENGRWYSPNRQARNGSAMPGNRWWEVAGRQAGEVGRGRGTRTGR